MFNQPKGCKGPPQNGQRRILYCSGIMRGGIPKSHANKSKAGENRHKPTSTAEGPVVARRVATLAVQGGGDRGGGGRGDIVLRGAGGQMVVPMSIFEGWHRHVGSVIGILVCGEIDGGMRLLSCSDRRKLVVSHRIKKLTRRRPDERESNARLRVSFERNLDPF